MSSARAAVAVETRLQEKKRLKEKKETRKTHSCYSIARPTESTPAAPSKTPLPGRRSPSLEAVTTA